MPSNSKYNCNEESEIISCFILYFVYNKIANKNIIASLESRCYSISKDVNIRISKNVAKTYNKNRTCNFYIYILIM